MQYRKERNKEDMHEQNHGSKDSSSLVEERTIYHDCFNNDPDEEYDREFREKYGPILKEIEIRVDELIFGSIMRDPNNPSYVFSAEFERKMELLIETYFGEESEKQT